MKKKIIQGIVLFAFVHLLVFSFYSFVSVEISDKAFYLNMRRFIPATLVALIPIWLLRKPLFAFNSLSYIIVSCSWIITTPLLGYISYKHSALGLSRPYDVAFGLYIFAIMVTLHYFLQKILSRKISALLVTIFQMLLLVIPILQWIYFIVFKKGPSAAAVMAIYQTNINEAIEFLVSFGSLALILTAVFFFALFISLYKMNVNSFTANIIKVSKYSNILLLAVLIIPSFYVTKKLFVSTDQMGAILSIHDYFRRAALYKDKYDEKYKNLLVTANGATPKTVVLVIGESQTRTEMSVYNSERSINNTPWLSNQKDNSNFLIFNNIYSCAPQTVPVLEKALTESNYYNNINFNEAVSIIDIAKKAGFTTYWFSNQDMIGGADTPITLVAQTADVAQWTTQEINKRRHDELLLPYLDNVDRTKNSFIVIHIMGSHDDYHNRYPKEFQKWTEKVMDTQSDYDNTILYTDYILSQIYEYSKENLNLDVMIYFSDHGVDPIRRRQPDETGFKTTRVPMFIYFSDEYKQANQNVYNVLQDNINTYMTNDLTYDLMCDLFNINSTNCDKQNSIASGQFKFKRSDLLTNMGKKFIKDDISY